MGKTEADSSAQARQDANAAAERPHAPPTPVQDPPRKFLESALHPERPLHGVWRLEGNLESGRPVDIEARVPGVVHEALREAELIPDPLTDHHEPELEWIGRHDWTFRRTFDLSEDWFAFERIDLVCEGLDTVATIEINGEPIGRSVDMHAPARFPARRALREKDNQIVVRFASPIREAERTRDAYGDPASSSDRAALWSFIRKMACELGGDRRPPLASCGIWRPIRLQAWRHARIEQVRPLVREATARRAVVEIHIDTETTVPHDPAPSTQVPSPERPKLDLGASLFAPDGTRVACDRADASGVVRLEIPNPQLWHPIGHGQQPLYDLKIKLIDPDKRLIDQWRKPIGLRTVRLNTEPDEFGSKFQLEVNGRPIYCKGAIWKPDEVFPSRIDEARYERRIRQAVDANMNMLRVWGGGLFERETFYEICDRLGVMVWQDFPFTAAASPEATPFAQLIEREARPAVARLARHPSHVIWNGGDQTLGAPAASTPEQTRSENAGSQRHEFRLLPAVVNELDPVKPYWPNSPWSGSWEFSPNDNDRGDCHVLDRELEDRSPDEHAAPPTRFASAFGVQGACWEATLREALESAPSSASDQDPTHESTASSASASGGKPAHGSRRSPARHPAVLARRRHDEASRTIQRRLDRWFHAPPADDPARFADWVFLSQIHQARTVQRAIEFWRATSPRNTGALIRRLNDCRAGFSGSAIDGAGRPKLLWYAARRAYADRLITLQPEGDGSRVLIAVNDHPESWQGDVRLTRVDFAGRTLAEHRAWLDVPPRANLIVDELPDALTRPDDASGSFVRVEMRSTRAADEPGVRHEAWFARDRALPYPHAAFDHEHELDPAGRGARVRVHARSLLRELCLAPKTMPPGTRADEQMVTLLPGESFAFTIRDGSAPDALDPARLSPWLRREAVRCVNPFGASAEQPNGA